MRRRKLLGLLERALLGAAMTLALRLAERRLARRQTG
jgi:hypothetical protein